MDVETPVMAQYAAAKRRFPEALLFFRMGDFFELFFEDAEKASRLLGLTLTSRDKGESPVPMAGLAAGSAATRGLARRCTLRRLTIRAGLSVWWP